MTESFILNAFRKMGETPLSVKVMRNKFTGEPAGYCFVHFANDDDAIDAMHKLNSKPIPGTNPVVRFRLNNASNNTSRQFIDREFSVWVGDLSPDVDDYNLYRVFSSKYNTIKTAKGGYRSGCVGFPDPFLKPFECNETISHIFKITGKKFLYLQLSWTIAALVKVMDLSDLAVKTK